MDPTNSQQVFDSSISFKLAGLVVVSLIVVFFLQYAGFRFVVSAGRV